MRPSTHLLRAEGACLIPLGTAIWVEHMHAGHGQSCTSALRLAGAEQPCQGHERHKGQPALQTQLEAQLRSWEAQNDFASGRLSSKAGHNLAYGSILITGVLMAGRSPYLCVKGCQIGRLQVLGSQAQQG